MSFSSSLTQERNNTNQSDRARYVVLAKGMLDGMVALSIMFFPAVIYDGPVAAVISKFTGLQFIYRDADPGGAYAIASLVMGCAFAAISAGMSKHEDAYKVIATMNGVFAYCALLGCWFSPKRYGSSVLLLAAVQSAFWFFLIAAVGGYTMIDTLGWRTAADKLKKKVHEAKGQCAPETKPTSAERKPASDKRDILGGTHN
ncbi:hypothetical protein P691DRAFT_797420 [Macrolepiota fuliginosa MF-IS2]|uniref:Uncharacterized protein n=1 Tax=Macrolepiota fuliginosa MF-IS2 TaxID=1400762 RepID=A0A9P5X4C8_9AGAR|nr:hypothetical protein P691DRAFT_797420 [Macrolepiota fuliginosa MF-IS2]